MLLYLTARFEVTSHELVIYMQKKYPNKKSLEKKVRSSPIPKNYQESHQQVISPRS
jgi:hypothetical protein